MKQKLLLFKVPGYPLSDLLSRLYPYYLLLNKEGKQAVDDIYKVSAIYREIVIY